MLRELGAIVLCLLKPSTWRDPYRGRPHTPNLFLPITETEAPLDLPFDHDWQD